MEDSIFTKIIKGDIPCHKVYEDEYAFAFMDIYPIQPGQVVVVSKKPVSNFFDLDETDYRGFTGAVKKIAIKMKAVFPDKKRIGVMIEGLEVDHVHAKLFPINTGDEFRAEPNTSTEPDHEVLAEMAKKIAF